MDRDPPASSYPLGDNGLTAQELDTTINGDRFTPNDDIGTGKGASRIRADIGSSSLSLDTVVAIASIEIVVTTAPFDNIVTCVPILNVIPTLAFNQVSVRPAVQERRISLWFVSFP